MAVVSDLKVRIGADMTDFERKLQSAQAKMQDFGDKMGRVGQTLSTRLTLPIAAIGGAMLKSAADAEEMQSKFNAVFKGSGDGVTASLTEFATSVNRSRFELMGMAASFGDILKPMGFTQEQAADMSVDLVKLATDLSSFNNMPMDEALRRLRGTMIGAHENAAEFGVIINETTLKQELMAMGTADLTGKELELAKAQARINLLFQGTTDAQGDAARTAGSLTNEFRGMVDRVKDLGIEFGQRLMPIAQKVIDRIARLTDWFSDLDDSTKDLILTIGGISALLGPLALGISAVIAVMNPWVVAIGAVVAAGALLIQNWGEVVAWMDTKFPGASDKFMAIWEQIKDTVQTVMFEIWDAVQPALQDIREFWAKWGDEITTIVSLMMNTALDLFRTGLKFLGETFGLFINIFTGDWSGAWENIKGIFGAIWDRVKSIFKNALDAIFDLIPGGDALKKKLGFDAMVEGSEEVEKQTGLTSEELANMADKYGGLGTAAKDAKPKVDETAESTRKQGNAAEDASEKTNKYARSVDDLRKKLDDALSVGNRFYTGLETKGVDGTIALEGATLRTTTAVEDLGGAVGDTTLGFEGWASVLTSEGGLGRGIDQLVGKLGSDGLLGHVKGLFNSIGGGEGLISTLSGEGGLTGTLSKVAAALGPGAPIAAAFIAATQLVKKYADEINGAIGALSDFFGFSGGGASEMRDEIITDELKKQFRQSFEASGMTATAFVDLAMRDEDKAAFINDLFGSPEDAATFLADGVIGGTGLSSEDATHARNADAWANNPNNPANQDTVPVSRPEGEELVPDFTGGAPDLPDSKPGPEGSGRDRPSVGSGRGFGHFQEMGREFGDLADVMHEEFGSGRFCNRLSNFGDNVAGMVPDARDIGESVAQSMYHGARDSRAGVDQSQDVVLVLNDREVGRALMDGHFGRTFVDRIISGGG